MKRATKAAESPYYKARMACSEYNDKVTSREGASEVTGIERTRLARIELGSLTPYPEEVMMMSDTYNAPELMNYHCTTDCPIGRQTLEKADVKNIEQIAVNMYSSLKNSMLIKETIIEIAEDGTLDEEEKPKIKEVMEMLKDISKVAAELQILAKKVYGKGAR